MGKLTHAPVFYVVAQVTHSPVLKLDSLIPELQDHLRKEGFPGYRSQSQVTLQIEANPTTPGETKVNHALVTQHIFSTRDGSASFVVGQDTVAYQTVEYQTIDVFADIFARGIRAIQKVLAPDSFTRIGMRFLDAVTPREGATPSEYIRKQFLGLQDTLGNDWETAYTFSEAMQSRGEQQARVRVLTRSSELAWPPDLAPTAPRMPERFAGIVGVHTVIDSDASFSTAPEAAQEFDERVILDRLLSLKVDIRDVFQAVVTEAALRDWA